MILNIEPGTFGGPMRMGDLIGVCNVVAYLRKVKNDPNIRFFLQPGSVSVEEHVQFFHNFLVATTDYFSAFNGTESLPWRKVNLWDFRDISGDLVSIHNFKQKKKKIVIWPVLDAPYNTYRNWPIEVYKKYIDRFSRTEYNGYEKIICTKTSGESFKGWKASTDFLENLFHVMESEIFVGGDTGASHFAWSLDNPPKELIYCNSSRGLIHTTPFYLMQGKGRTETYWLDFEGTRWN